MTKHLPRKFLNVRQGLRSATSRVSFPDLTFFQKQFVNISNNFYTILDIWKQDVDIFLYLKIEVNRSFWLFLNLSWNETFPQGGMFQTKQTGPEAEENQTRQLIGSSVH